MGELFDMLLYALPNPPNCRLGILMTPSTREDETDEYHKPLFTIVKAVEMINNESLLEYLMSCWCTLQWT